MEKLASKSSRRSALSARLSVYSATAGAAILATSPADAMTTITSGAGGNLLVSGSLLTGSFPALTNIASSTASAVEFTVGGFHGKLLGGSFFNDMNYARFYAVSGSVLTDLGGVAKNFAFGSLLAGTGTPRSDGLLAASYGLVGNFAPGTGYVGFQFQNSGIDYHGWLRVRVTLDSRGVANSVTLLTKEGSTDVYGAYDLASNPLTAGTVPEPSTVALSGLGLLALGATGVRELRRRRTAQIATGAAKAPEAGGL